MYRLRDELVRLEQIAYRLPNPADLGVTLSPESELMYDRLRRNLFADAHLMDDLLAQCTAERVDSLRESAGSSGAGVRRPESREDA